MWIKSQDRYFKKVKQDSDLARVFKDDFLEEVMLALSYEG